MSHLSIFKPMIAKAPLLLKKAGKAIDVFGDGDGVFELGDVVEAVKHAAESLIEVVTDWL